MTGRETFTRDEVKKIIRQTSCDHLKAASNMLRHNRHGVAADVLLTMANKIRKDDDLVNRTIDAAEDTLSTSLILDTVA